MDRQDPRWLDAVTAAYLLTRGHTQEQIAKILGLNQSKVSRLLKAVRSQFVKDEQPTFVEENVPPGLLPEILARATPNALGTKLHAIAQREGHAGPSVHLIPVATKHERPDVQQFRAFCSQAASVVRDLLMKVETRVGVAWGNTLWQVTQALHVSFPQRPWRKGRPVEFVPLCGDPLIDSALTHADRTASRIASDLSRIVNGEDVMPTWLGLVPAFIPRAFRKDDVRVIERFIGLVPQYRRTFGPAKSGEPPHLADDLPMILTASGSAARPVNLGHSTLFKLTEEEKSVLMTGVHGDIGGVLIPRVNASARTKRLIDEVTRYWTGLKMGHLETCASQARMERGSQSRPGVVLLSFEEDRADVVVEAVRRGLVNHLIIGLDVQHALERRITSHSDLA